MGAISRKRTILFNVFETFSLLVVLHGIAISGWNWISLKYQRQPFHVPPISLLYSIWRFGTIIN